MILKLADPEAYRNANKNPIKLDPLKLKVSLFEMVKELSFTSLSNKDLIVPLLKSIETPNEIQIIKTLCYLLERKFSQNRDQSTLNNNMADIIQNLVDHKKVDFTTLQKETLSDPKHEFNFP